MAEKRVQRRLAAILAADVVGYSKLMGADEVGTLARLNALTNELLEPKVAEYGGRIVKTTGDGALIEFPSAVDAVQHAVDVQQAIARRNADLPEAERLEVRIGINLGDIIVEGEDIFGEGVNVAARLEGLAEPGGICISAIVHESVRTKLDLAFTDLGEKTLKNIAEPVRTFAIALDRSGAEANADLSSEALLRRPAVAVLPFENLSGDLEQDYFADGLTEDLITALSLCRSFPVIARNSTFAYKGQAPDIRKVGEELGARYVVEGSVRRASNRVRVTAQLIDAETGHHVWAERYDREIADIFELQDEIIDHIAAILEPAIERSERQRVTTKPPNDLAAWEYWLRGYAYIYEETEEANAKAREMFSRAVALDPSYARAHTGLAFTFGRDLRFWPPKDREEWLRLFAKSSRRAVELDESDSEARTMLARVYMFSGEYDAAIAEAERAVQLNPHRAWSNNILGNLLVVTGRFEEGIPWIERAQMLNPIDPRQHLLLTHLALAHLGAGHYEKAIELAQDAIRRKGDFIEANVYLASALGYLNRGEEAARALHPFQTSAWTWLRNQKMYAPATKERILHGLRKAGLTE